MFKTFKLLLPALIPSWRFFDFIVASPRVQFALLTAKNELIGDWQEFRPRPAQLSFAQMLKRMLWNPDWNESLFLVSCAERLLENPTQHSEDEILKRIQHALCSDPENTLPPAASQLQFRLQMVERKGATLHRQVDFISRRQPLCHPTRA